MPETVVLRKGDSVVEVPSERAGEYTFRGYTPETTPEHGARIGEEMGREEAGGLTSKVVAGVTSTLGGATLGLSDVALRAGLAPEDLRYVARAREAHPIIGTAGNVAGAIGAAALTGGGSVEARAALPGGAVLEGGAALRGAIGEAVPGFVGKIAGYGAEGSLVGSAQNVGNYISDVALGNRDLSAEAFWSEAGNGAAWGGVAGGALGAAERGLVSARRLFAKADLGDVAEHTAKVVDAVDTAGDTVKAARAEVDRINGAIAQHRAEMRVGAASIRAEQAQQQLEIERARAAFRAAKVPGEAPLAAQGLAADAAAADANAAIDVHATQTGDAMAERAKRLTQLADATERGAQATRAIAEGDGDLLAQLRGTKRGLEEGVTLREMGAREAPAAADRLGQVFPGERVTPFEGGTLSEADVPLEARLAGRFRTFGEPPPSWLHEVEEAIDHVGGFEQAHADLVRELGPGASPVARTLAAQHDAAVAAARDSHATSAANAVADASKTRGLADDKAISKAEKTLADHQERLRSMRLSAAETRAKNAGTTFDLEGQLAGAKSGLAEAGGAAAASATEPAAAPAPKAGRLGKLSEIGAVLEAARTLGVPGIPDPHDIPVIGPILSLALKAKAVRMAIGKGGQTAIADGVKARVAMRAVAAKEKIAKAIDAAIAGTGTARVAAEIAIPRAAEVLGHGVFLGSKPEQKDGNVRELAAARSADIARAVSNPDAIAAAVRSIVPTADAHLQSTLATVQQRKAAYLDSVRPPIPAPDPLGRKMAPVSTAEAERFANVVRAVEHPLSILEDLRAGTLTADAVKAVDAVYPNLMQHMRLTILQTVAAAGKEVPYRTRVRLGVLFGGDVDASLAHVVELQRAAPKPTPQQQPASPTAQATPSVSGNPQLARLYSTDQDRRALGGRM